MPPELTQNENPFASFYEEAGEQSRPWPAIEKTRRYEHNLSLTSSQLSHFYVERSRREIIERLAQGSYRRSMRVRQHGDIDLTALSGQQTDYRDLVRLIKQWHQRRVPGLTQAEINRLEAHYIVREQSHISAFIAEHPFLLSLLIEAPGRIRERFGDVRLALHLSQEPDNADSKELFIYILTPLSADEAFPLLEQLDEEWWLEASDRAQWKLNLKIEYV